ncbi:6391_t:CDS:2 [Paraglomus occultum]|uniref:6391_t:CDS:1 n=1 Tax=Paraglomus occultum TaxID=144539 RepID=A0A9N9BHL7_9GLOM|nr:6391_t:CDS:2 [Paraglomus occultum]
MRRCAACKVSTVYIDPRTGETGEFCSNKCRKAAVYQGIVEACKHCNKYPRLLGQNGQRLAYCGGKCKNEAGAKTLSATSRHQDQKYSMPNHQKSLPEQPVPNRMFIPAVTISNQPNPMPVAPYRPSGSMAQAYLVPNKLPDTCLNITQTATRSTRRVAFSTASPMTNQTKEKKARFEISIMSSAGRPSSHTLASRLPTLTPGLQKAAKQKSLFSPVALSSSLVLTSNSRVSVPVCQICRMTPCWFDIDSGRYAPYCSRKCKEIAGDRIV